MRYNLSDLMRVGAIFVPERDEVPSPTIKFKKDVCVSMSVVQKGILMLKFREIPVSVYLSSTSPSYVKEVYSDSQHSAQENKRYLYKFIRSKLFENDRRNICCIIGRCIRKIVQFLEGSNNASII